MLPHTLGRCLHGTVAKKKTPTGRTYTVWREDGHGDPRAAPAQTGAPSRDSAGVAAWADEPPFH